MNCPSSRVYSSTASPSIERSTGDATTPTFTLDDKQKRAPPRPTNAVENNGRCCNGHADDDRTTTAGGVSIIIHGSSSSSKNDKDHARRRSTSALALKCASLNDEQQQTSGPRSPKPPTRKLGKQSHVCCTRVDDDNRRRRLGSATKSGTTGISCASSHTPAVALRLANSPRSSPPSTAAFASRPASEVVAVQPSAYTDPPRRRHRFFSNFQLAAAAINQRQSQSERQLEGGDNKNADNRNNLTTSRSSAIASQNVDSRRSISQRTCSAVSIHENSKFSDDQPGTNSNRATIITSPANPSSASNVIGTGHQPHCQPNGEKTLNNQNNGSNADAGRSDRSDDSERSQSNDHDYNCGDDSDGFISTDSHNKTVGPENSLSKGGNDTDYATAKRDHLRTAAQSDKKLLKNLKKSDNETQTKNHNKESTASADDRDKNVKPTDSCKWTQRGAQSDVKTTTKDTQSAKEKNRKTK